MCFWHRSFLKNINISKLELCLNYHWMALSSLFSWSEIQEKATTRQIKHRSFYWKIVQGYSYLKFQNYLTATMAEMFFTFYLFVYFFISVCVCLCRPKIQHENTAGYYKNIPCDCGKYTKYFSEVPWIEWMWYIARRQRQCKSF